MNNAMYLTVFQSTVYVSKTLLSVIWSNAEMNGYNRSTTRRELQEIHLDKQYTKHHYGKRDLPRWQTASLNKLFFEDVQSTENTCAFKDDIRWSTCPLREPVTQVEGGWDSAFATGESSRVLE